MAKRSAPVLKALLVILGVSLAFECLLTAAAFIAPARAMEVFKVVPTPDTLFLAHVLGWMFLLTSLVCGVCFRWVRTGEKAGWTLAYLLGSWWVAIGLALVIGYGRWDHLFLDTLKGALIFALAWHSRKNVGRH